MDSFGRGRTIDRLVGRPAALVVAAAATLFLTSTTADAFVSSGCRNVAAAQASSLYGFAAKQFDNCSKAVARGASCDTAKRDAVARSRRPDHPAPAATRGRLAGCRRRRLGRLGRGRGRRRGSAGRRRRLWPRPPDALRRRARLRRRDRKRGRARRQEERQGSGPLRESAGLRFRHRFAVAGRRAPRRGVLHPRRSRRSSRDRSARPRPGDAQRRQARSRRSPALVRSVGQRGRARTERDRQPSGNPLQSRRRRLGRGRPPRRLRQLLRDRR